MRQPRLHLPLEIAPGRSVGFRQPCQSSNWNTQPSDWPWCAAAGARLCSVVMSHLPAIAFLAATSESELKTEHPPGSPARVEQDNSARSSLHFDSSYPTRPPPCQHRSRSPPASPCWAISLMSTRATRGGRSRPWPRNTVSGRCAIVLPSKTRTTES